MSALIFKKGMEETDKRLGQDLFEANTTGATEAASVIAANGNLIRVLLSFS